MTIRIKVTKKMLFAAALLVVLAVGGVSWVQALDPEATVAPVCIRNSDGQVRIVEDIAECRSNESYAYLATGEAVVQFDERVDALEDLLMHFSKDGDDITIRGANLRVVNGLGGTETTNELGNLIIGYNELRGADDDRSGSHMLVVGKNNNYSSYGGIVGGRSNYTLGAFSSVSGGRENVAEGDYSSVSGGEGNEARGESSSISGGQNNQANGFGASVSGGSDNVARNDYSSVSGGQSNGAIADYVSISGGEQCFIIQENGWGVGIPGYCR